MFTWICPQCGREVPPAYNDCPDCSKKTAPGRRPGAGAAADTGSARRSASSRRRRTHRHRHRSSSLTTSNLPAAAAPASPAVPSAAVLSTAPRTAAAGDTMRRPLPPRGLNLPVWLMTILFAMAIAGVVFGILWMVSTNRGSAGNGPAPIASVESPAAKPGSQDQPAAEVHRSLRRALRAGCQEEDRWRSSSSSTTPRRTSTGSPATSPSGGVLKNPRKTRRVLSPSIPTWRRIESKELSVPLNTKRKIYELGDWQNLTTDVQITAPAGGA